MADVQVDAGGLKRTLKDLFAGAAGGVAQVLLGQYFHRSAVKELELNWERGNKKVSIFIKKQPSDLVVVISVCFSALKFPLRLLNWPC